jgi:hypothetical protein
MKCARFLRVIAFHGLKWLSKLRASRTWTRYGRTEIGHCMHDMIVFLVSSA